MSGRWIAAGDRDPFAAPILRLGIHETVPDRVVLDLRTTGVTAGLEVVGLAMEEIPPPRLDGLLVGWRSGAPAIARRFRGIGYAGPLVAALRRPSPEEVVAALASGCDDAQPFPCTVVELSARIAAIRRRQAQARIRPDVIRAGRLEIGRDGDNPRVDGKPLKVSPNCCRVLALIAASRQPVPQQRIAAMLYGAEPPPSNTVNTYLCLLRSIMAVATGTGGWLRLKDGGYVLFDPED